MKAIKHTSTVHYEREFQVGKQTSEDKQKKPLAQGSRQSDGYHVCPESNVSYAFWHKLKFLQDLHLLEAWERKHSADLIRLAMAFPRNLVPWHLDLDVLTPLPFSSSRFSSLSCFFFTTQARCRRCWHLLNRTQPSQEELQQTHGGHNKKKKVVKAQTGARCQVSGSLIRAEQSCLSNERQRKELESKKPLLLTVWQWRPTLFVLI